MLSAKLDKYLYDYGHYTVAGARFYAARMEQLDWLKPIIDAPREPAIPKLLELLELSGALVTIDAMGCQTEIDHTIVDAGADVQLQMSADVAATSNAAAQTFTLPASAALSRGCSACSSSAPWSAFANPSSDTSSVESFWLDRVPYRP